MRRTSGNLIAGWCLLLALSVAGCVGRSVVARELVATDGGGMDAGMDAVVSCTGDTILCGSSCVNTRSDRRHCGACGRACEALQVCLAGTCQLGCPAGQQVCNGQCVNLQTDRTNCGACGTVCPAGRVCSLGACATTCDARLAMCAASDAGAGAGAYCADTATDDRNCGACGNVCPLGQRCSERRCQVTCAVGQTECAGACRDTQTDRAHCGACGRACAAGEVCVAGACQLSCGASLADCNGSCRDLATDLAHCGACGRACPSGSVCSRGACALSCGSGLTSCNGTCRDLTSDRAHCGMCGRACNAGEVCSDGVCQVSCGAGLDNCEGVCRDLTTDRAHCGACGRGCDEGEVCSAGVCQVSCATRLADCGGVCRDLTTDRTNCGMCGRACPSGQVCSNGACAPSCGTGLRNCGGTCRDLDTDRENCGACDTPCAAGQLCSQGICALSCQDGLVNCEGVCRDLQTDRSHCGACGRACPSGQVCSNGTCAASCAASLTLCSGQCANLQTDEANCGMCGRACAPGTQCMNGTCATTCAPQLGTCGTGASAFCANSAVDPANCGMCGRACMLAHTALNGCAAGECTVVRCEANFGDCDGDPANGCELDLRGDASNCGGCGRVCSFANAQTMCAMGACAMGMCRRGFADCDRSPANGCETDTNTSAMNCGACGTTCPSGQVCSAGACVTACTNPYATCGAGTASVRCANTASDPSHCGACGTACALPRASASVCAAGNCAVLTCTSGYGDCDGDATNGCETDLRASSAHCGACGRACTLANASAGCTAGSCAVLACTRGFADCDGTPGDGCEVDTRTDNANCGACGNACPAGQVCSNGTCTTTCAMPLTRCTDTTATDGRTGDFCANTAHDPANCGMCGTRCNLAHVATHACTAGACAIVRCAPGFGDCDGMAANGCETDLGTTLAHCGACGRACAPPNATGTCATGRCGVMACATGFADCNNVATDGCETATATDRSNCGACGTRCPAGQVCAGGSCATTCGAPFSTCMSTGGSFCANTANDPANCGSCGTRCDLDHTASAACMGGACAPATCDAGFGNCDMMAANGCETNLLTTAAHCGGCGRLCSLANATTSCTAGACAVTSCTTGFGNCNGLAADGCETNTQNDPDHCGACGNACLAGQVCTAGRCASVCPAGQTDCAGACSNTAFDPDHCGTCATMCPSRPNTTRWCTAGTCGTACVVGRGDCDGMAANGCERDVSGDVMNCGACNNACPARANATPTCAMGACSFACNAGFADCDMNPVNGCEVDTRSTNAHCGACGSACVAGRTCQAGSCRLACATGLTECGGACVDTRTSLFHCGTCGNGCAAGQTCVAGMCRLVCPTGQTACGSACVDLMTSSANCGMCGRACATGESCLGGTCIAGCASGTTRCGSACVNLTSDANNCGTCGMTCPTRTNAAPACSGATCGLTCNAGFGNCDSNPSNGCETDVTSSPLHCGACGAICNVGGNASAVCRGGSCSLTCAMGYSDCDGMLANGCEANVNTSAANCGTCGRACATGETCTAGTCTAAQSIRLSAPYDAPLPGNGGLFFSECPQNAVSNFVNAANAACARTIPGSHWCTRADLGDLRARCSSSSSEDMFFLVNEVSCTVMRFTLRGTPYLAIRVATCPAGTYGVTLSTGVVARLQVPCCN